MARREQEFRKAAGRAYWREADARIVVEAWRASGEPMAAFCRRYDLRTNRLSRWLKRLEGDGRETTAAISFLPVRVRDGALREGRSGSSVIVVRLGGELCVEITEGFDGATLRRVLEALRDEAAW